MEAVFTFTLNHPEEANPFGGAEYWLFYLFLKRCFIILRKLF